MLSRASVMLVMVSMVGSSGWRRAKSYKVLSRATMKVVMVQRVRLCTTATPTVVKLTNVRHMNSSELSYTNV